MLRGGSARRAALVVAFGVLIVTLSLVAAYSSSTYIPATTASSTLTLALPGPFSGCPASSTTLNDSTRAILDLTRPSAFQTGYDGQLVGEGGAIVSAELTSLAPETVVYTVNTHLLWSNGRAFGASDLVAWWHREIHAPGLLGEGYRDIRQMTISSSGLQVTATFGATTPFTEWNLLFRDVEAPTTSTSCDISLLASRPALGPYLVTSASSSLVILSANPNWPLNYNRFQNIIIEAASPTVATGQFYVGFSPSVTSNDLGALAAHNSYASSFVPSSSVLEMAFSPTSPLVSSLDVRSGLAWALSRAHLLSRIDPTGGSSGNVPTSVLYPVSSPLYPSAQLSPAISPVSPELSGTALDCPRCSAQALQRGGWHLTDGHWVIHHHEVVVTLGVGPSEIDRRAAGVVSSQWTSLGLRVVQRSFASDSSTAAAAATGVVSVAVYTRPLGSSPWWAVSSFAPIGGEVSYPTGVTTPVLAHTLKLVKDDFNPQVAQVSWEMFDQWLQRWFWLRPLATPPALTLWSGRVGNVQPASTVAGLVDQIPNWGVAPPHSVPTTTTTVRTS